MTTALQLEASATHTSNTDNQLIKGVFNVADIEAQATTRSFGSNNTRLLRGVFDVTDIEASQSLFESNNNQLPPSKYLQQRQLPRFVKDFYIHFRYF